MAKRLRDANDDDDQAFADPSKKAKIDEFTQWHVIMLGLYDRSVTHFLYTPIDTPMSRMVVSFLMTHTTVPDDDADDSLDSDNVERLVVVSAESFSSESDSQSSDAAQTQCMVAVLLTAIADMQEANAFAYYTRRVRGRFDRSYRGLATDVADAMWTAQSAADVALLFGSCRQWTPADTGDDTRCVSAPPWSDHLEPCRVRVLYGLDDIAEPLHLVYDA